MGARCLAVPAGIGADGRRPPAPFDGRRRRLRPSAAPPVGRGRRPTAVCSACPDKPWVVRRALGCDSAVAGLGSRWGRSQPVAGGWGAGVALLLGPSDRAVGLGRRRDLFTRVAGGWWAVVVPWVVVVPWRG